MKHIFLLLVIVLPLSIFGKGNDHLKGHWRETGRWTTGEQELEYSDTMFFSFTPTGEYTWQKAGGFIYRGTYKVENNNLDIGMQYYSILDKQMNKLILKDQNSIHQFEPYIPQKVESDPRPKENYRRLAEIRFAAGEWEKYKGTSDKKQQSINYDRSIKKVVIFDEAEDGKWGYVYAGNDGNEPSWYIESYSNDIMYLNGKDLREVKVLNMKDNELILKEDGFNYFMRRFNK